MAVGEQYVFGHSLQFCEASSQCWPVGQVGHTGALSGQ